jgi:hypothetical protein
MPRSDQEDDKHDEQKRPRSILHAAAAVAVGAGVVLAVDV